MGYAYCDTLAIWTLLVQGQKLKACQLAHIAHTVTLCCNGAAEAIGLPEPCVYTVSMMCINVHACIMHMLCVAGLLNPLSKCTVSTS